MVSEVELRWQQTITDLASRKGVRKIAVENYLLSIDSNNNQAEAECNLNNDVVSYNWNYATYKAIHQGIVYYYKNIKPRMGIDEFMKGVGDKCPHGVEV